MDEDIYSLLSEGATDNCALAGDDVFGTVVVDMGFQVEAKQVSLTQGARRQAVCANAALVLLHSMVSNCLACFVELRTSKSFFMRET